MDANQSCIQFGGCESGLYLAVTGGADDRLCAVAERLLSDYLSAHGGPPRVFLDLSACDWLCSTFAGWLLTLRKKLKSTANQGFLRITACSAGSQDCLDRMHIMPLFEQCSAAKPARLGQVQCGEGSALDRHTVELMLNAHQELAAIDAENQRVFGPIAAMLRGQLEKFPRPSA